MWFEIWVLWGMDELIWVLKVCGKGDLVKGQAFSDKEGMPENFFL